VHHLYKFRLTTRAGELRTANIAIAPLLSRARSVGLHHPGRRHRPNEWPWRQLAQDPDSSAPSACFAAGVRHEINTPLAVIAPMAQMLAKQLRGDVRLGPVLDKITQQELPAPPEIANGLLNFSRTSRPSSAPQT